MASAEKLWIGAGQHFAAAGDFMLQVQQKHQKHQKQQQQQNTECCTPVASILHATGWVAPPFCPRPWPADADDGQQWQFGL